MVRGRFRLPLPSPSRGGLVPTSRAITELWGAADARQKLSKDITTLLGKGEVWAGLFTWENIASWHWRMKTSKSKYRSADPSGGDARRQDYGGSDNNVRIVRQNFVRTF